MSLKLNLGDIHLTFQVKGYHKPQNKSWDEEWCKISLSLRSRDWLNYKIVEDEILLCCEIDALTKQLETVRNYKQLEKRTLSFIEPDFNFTFYPSANNRTPIVDWIINFWTDRKALSANCLLSYPEKFDVLFNKERKQLCVIDDKSLSSETKDARTPFTAPHGDFSCESNMFLLKLLQYVPNLENGKIYSLLGFYRADINGVIFSLSDYQLTEECSQ